MPAQRKKLTSWDMLAQLEKGAFIHCPNAEGELCVLGKFNYQNKQKDLPNSHLAVRKLLHFACIFPSLRKLSLLLDDSEGDSHRGGGGRWSSDLSSCFVISEAWVYKH